MKKLYRAPLLVSGNAPPLDDGALLVEGGRILAVGRYKDLVREYSAADVTDFGDGIMVPMLVNAHTHLDLTDFPAWAQKVGETEEPQNFVDWILHLVRVKRNLCADDFKQSVGHGIALSIAGGSGLVGDILAHHSAAEMYRGRSLPGRLFFETLGRDPSIIERVRHALDVALEQKNYGGMTSAVSAHSPYTICSDYLQEIYRHCRQNHLFCSTHLAESVDEVDFIQHSRGTMVDDFFPAIGWDRFVPEPSGIRPVAYLNRHGGLFPQNLLVHGVQLNADEIDLLASKRMAVALCPRSNSRLKVGKAPAGKMLDSGVRLALGTDSLASCDSLSIWDEMAFAHSWFAGELDGPTLFYLATLGGADALGMAELYGSLEQGKVAAFQVLKPKTTVAQADVFDYFVAPGCSSDIAHVFMDGSDQLTN